MPEYKDVKERIARKLRRDLSRPLSPAFHASASRNEYWNGDARELAGVRSNSIDLVVTSPPFLDKVDYAGDNWMRAWFLDLEEVMAGTKLAIMSDTMQWKAFMEDVMRELLRVLRVGGKAVIEVGEVAVGQKVINLEELLISFSPVAKGKYRLVPVELYINKQSFTKLANCWDVKNNEKGTNTNRCLVFEKMR